MRFMDTYVKGVNQTLAIATWEVAVGQRDVVAERKRQQETATEGLLQLNRIAKTIRAQKLKELYDGDEAMYEEELTAKGLTFRKERL